MVFETSQLVNGSFQEKSDSKPRKTGKISFQKRLNNRSRIRKQSDSLIQLNTDVAEELVNLQSTTNVSIPQIPFQQMVESEEITKSKDVVYSDDKCDIDFLESDILMKILSQESSISNVASKDEANEDTEQSNIVSFEGTNAGQRRSRKQTKSKRKDRVAREMIRLQHTTNLLIPKLPFQRLVREVLMKYRHDFRMQSSTLECLQEAAESYLVQLFQDCYLCCLHRSRVTLTEKDVRLVQLLRVSTDVGRR